MNLEVRILKELRARFVEVRIVKALAGFGPSLWTFGLVARLGHSLRISTAAPVQASVRRFAICDARGDCRAGWFFVSA
jgi:hypothetical protein